MIELFLEAHIFSFFIIGFNQRVGDVSVLSVRKVVLGGGLSGIAIMSSTFGHTYTIMTSNLLQIQFSFCSFVATFLRLNICSPRISQFV